MAVVVGGGPAGLATALSLSRKGKIDGPNIRVVERGAQPSHVQQEGEWTGAALNLTAGVSVLNELGVDMRAIGLGTQLHRVSAWSTTSLSSPLYSANLSQVHTRSVLRGSLLEALVSECEADGIQLHFNFPVNSLTEDARAHRVHVHASEDEDYHLSAPLAVVAAGGRAATLLKKPAPKPAGCRILIALGEAASGRLDGGSDDIGSAEQVFGDGLYALRVTAGGLTQREGVRDVVYLSVGGNRSYSARRSEWAREHGNEQERLRRRMLDMLEAQGFPDDHTEIVKHAVALAEVGACVTPPQRSGETWRSGNRCTLLGDAARSMPPYLGQGANQALNDALALGLRIGQMQSLENGEELAQTLDSYERARAPVARVAVEASRIIGLVETCRWPLTLARNLSMRIAGALDLPGRLLQAGAQVRT